MAQRGFGGPFVKCRFIFLDLCQCEPNGIVHNLGDRDRLMGIGGFDVQIRGVLRIEVNRGLLCEFSHDVASFWKGKNMAFNRYNVTLPAVASELGRVLLQCRDFPKARVAQRILQRILLMARHRCALAVLPSPCLPRISFEVDWQSAPVI